MINAKNHQLVIPGQLIGEEIKTCDNCYKEQNKWYSSVLGIVSIDKDNNVNIKSVRGFYVPKEGDYVIGEIKSILPSFWIVSLGAYSAKLTQQNYPFKREAIKEGTFVRGKIINADLEDAEISLRCNECGLLLGGTIIYFDPSKMSKVIGNKGETIEKIKNLSKCEITYGYNGILWIRGPIEGIAKTIRILNTIELYCYSPKLQEVLEKELYVH